MCAAGDGCQRRAGRTCVCRWVGAWGVAECGTLPGACGSLPGRAGARGRAWARVGARHPDFRGVCLRGIWESGIWGIGNPANTAWGHNNNETRCCCAMGPCRLGSRFPQIPTKRAPGTGHRVPPSLPHPLRILASAPAAPLVQLLREQCLPNARRRLRPSCSSRQSD